MKNIYQITLSSSNLSKPPYFMAIPLKLSAGKNDDEDKTVALEMVKKFKSLSWTDINKNFVIIKNNADINKVAIPADSTLDFLAYTGYSLIGLSNKAISFLKINRWQINMKMHLIRLKKKWILAKNIFNQVHFIHIFAWIKTVKITY